MSDMLRTFIAINLDPKIQQSIKYIQDRLREVDCDVRWVTPENAHITLKFLGNITIKQVDVIKQMLANLYQNIKPFKVELTQLEAFPNIDRPRVFWIGFTNSKQQLNKMATTLEKALVKIGFQGDQKPFSPHITIGRIRSSKRI